MNVHFKERIKRLLLPLLLTAITLLLCLLNYQSGTWLSGWDTLHPEFNFSLYFKRILSFWQEHQGLGAPAAQSHLAELPRLLILFPLSLIFPASFLRYSYIFLCLILGPLGVYYFIVNLKQGKLAAFIASLFYLLNLTSVQHFIVPLEMFPTQFAVLPWLFLFSLCFLQKKRKKYLILFALVSFLGAPMAHTATLWYAWFFSFFLFIICYCLFSRSSVKSSLILIFTVLATNAFWLLPNLYFIKNHSQQVANSQIHFLFSEDAFLHSAQYGMLKDLVLFKNYLFNWYVYDFKSEQFVKLLGVWENHLNSFSIKVFSGFLFSLILFGAVSGLKKKKALFLGLLTISFLSLFFWLNINPPFGTIFLWLAGKLPLFKEAFRFPFTKFSLLYLFASAVFLSFGLNVTLNWLVKLIKKPKLVYIFTFSLSIFSLIYYALPAFKGYFISPQMRVEIPAAYFDLFAWFKKQPDGRIALLPANSMWGWKYYDWGYQGAGFLWFGLPQAFLDREFDRWYPTNEEFYYEFTQAIYSKDLSLLESVLEKYQVNWLILDENIKDIGDYKALYFPETEDLFARSAKIKLTREFGPPARLAAKRAGEAGSIKVYQVTLDTLVKDFVFLAQDLPQINSYSWNNDDTAFLDYGYYLSLSRIDNKHDPGSCLSVVYPFRSLFTGRKQEELEFEVEDKGDSFILGLMSIRNENPFSYRT